MKKTIILFIATLMIVSCEFIFVSCNDYNEEPNSEENPIYTTESTSAVIDSSTDDKNTFGGETSP